MAQYIIENIQKIFAFDTFVCSMAGVSLKEHMMLKHGWDDEKFNEFMNAYRSNCLCEKSENK
jgi:hypothetical protein